MLRGVTALRRFLQPLGRPAAVPSARRCISTRPVPPGRSLLPRGTRHPRPPITRAAQWGRGGGRRPHKIVLVAACVLVDGGRALMGKRPPGKRHGGLWEFPGGKVESDEGPEGALCREVKEELGVVIRKGDLVPLTFASTTFPDGPPCSMVRVVYVCRRWEGEVRSAEGQVLEWVDADQLAGVEVPPMEAPMVAQVQALLRANAGSP